MLTLLDAGPFVCGETPIWVEEEQSVYWVDTVSHGVYVHSFVSGESRKYQPEVPVSAIRRATDDSFYLLTKWGLYRWTPQSGGDRGQLLAGKDFLDPKGSIRFNDGIALSNGSFVAGAFDSAEITNGNGFLYLLDLDGEGRILDERLHVPNGMATSRDEKILYMVEMYKNRVLSYEIDDTLSVFSNRQVHISIPQDQGMPDGLLCDAEDNLWIAHWRGWQISRYDKQGVRNKVIETPFATPTCQCFKGTDESEMVLTTATLELSPDELSRSEHPGGVYLLRL